MQFFKQKTFKEINYRQLLIIHANTQELIIYVPASYAEKDQGT